MSSLPVFSLAGRSALVTGASHGIGAAVARAFAGAGPRSRNPVVSATLLFSKIAVVQ